MKHQKNKHEETTVNRTDNKMLEWYGYTEEMENTDS
jgi:hypothetical protein